MNTNKQDDEEEYKLTAKGLLCVKLMPFGVSFDKVDEIWNELADFARKQAKQSNYADGIPAIVLIGGGECITVATEKLEEFPEELEV